MQTKKGEDLSALKKYVNILQNYATVFSEDGEKHVFYHQKTK